VLISLNIHDDSATGSSKRKKFAGKKEEFDPVRAWGNVAPKKRAAPSCLRIAATFST
jgi:hypothetical protein